MIDIYALVDLLQKSMNVSAIRIVHRFVMTRSTGSSATVMSGITSNPPIRANVNVSLQL